MSYVPFYAPPGAIGANTSYPKQTRSAATSSQPTNSSLSSAAVFTQFNNSLLNQNSLIHGFSSTNTPVPAFLKHQQSGSTSIQQIQQNPQTQQKQTQAIPNNTNSNSNNTSTSSGMPFTYTKPTFAPAQTPFNLYEANSRQGYHSNISSTFDPQNRTTRSPIRTVQPPQQVSSSSNNSSSNNSSSILSAQSATTTTTTGPSQMMQIRSSSSKRQTELESERIKSHNNNNFHSIASSSCGFPSIFAPPTTQQQQHSNIMINSSNSNHYPQFQSKQNHSTIYSQQHPNNKNSPSRPHNSQQQQIQQHPLTSQNFSSSIRVYKPSETAQKLRIECDSLVTSINELSTILSTGEIAFSNVQSTANLITQLQQRLTYLSSQLFVTSGQKPKVIEPTKIINPFNANGSSSFSALRRESIEELLSSSTSSMNKLDKMKASKNNNNNNDIKTPAVTTTSAALDISDLTKPTASSNATRSAIAQQQDSLSNSKNREITLRFLSVTDDRIVNLSRARSAQPVSHQPSHTNPPPLITGGGLGITSNTKSITSTNGISAVTTQQLSSSSASDLVENLSPNNIRSPQKKQRAPSMQPTPTSSEKSMPNSSLQQQLSFLNELGVGETTSAQKPTNFKPVSPPQESTAEYGQSSEIRAIMESAKRKKDSNGLESSQPAQTLATTSTVPAPTSHLQAGINSSTPFKVTTATATFSAIPNLLASHSIQNPPSALTTSKLSSQAQMPSNITIKQTSSMLPHTLSTPPIESIIPTTTSINPPPPYQQLQQQQQQQQQQPQQQYQAQPQPQQQQIPQPQPQQQQQQQQQQLAANSEFVPLINKTTYLPNPMSSIHPQTPIELMTQMKSLQNRSTEVPQQEQSIPQPYTFQATTTPTIHNMNDLLKATENNPLTKNIENVKSIIPPQLSLNLQANKLENIPQISQKETNQEESPSKTSQDNNSTPLKNPLISTIMERNNGSSSARIDSDTQKPSINITKPYVSQANSPVNANNKTNPIIDFKSLYSTGNYSVLNNSIPSSELTKLPATINISPMTPLLQYQQQQSTQQLNNQPEQKSDQIQSQQQYFQLQPESKTKQQTMKNSKNIIESGSNVLSDNSINILSIAQIDEKLLPALNQTPVIIESKENDASVLPLPTEAISSLPVEPEVQAANQIVCAPPGEMPPAAATTTTIIPTKNEENIFYSPSPALPAMKMDPFESNKSENSSNVVSNENLSSYARNIGQSGVFTPEQQQQQQILQKQQQPNYLFNEMSHIDSNISSRIEALKVTQVDSEAKKIFSADNPNKEDFVLVSAFNETIKESKQTETNKEKAESPVEQTILPTKQSFFPRLRQSKSISEPIYEVVNPFKYSASNFQLGKKLGHGKFADVFAAADKMTGYRVALKIIKKSKIEEFNLSADLINEIRIQSSLSHPNIIQLYGFFIDESNVYLIQELACGKELFNELKASPYKVFTESQTSFFIRQVIEALIYMHSKNVIHRDIKPENIMVYNGLLKLCDFGYATKVTKDVMRNTFCGTLDYVSPEMVKGLDYDFSVDVWSIGILTYELIIGYAPFAAKDHDATFDKVVNGDLLFSSPISFEAGDFISRILRREPEERMTLVECLQHPFIQNEHIKRFNQSDSQREIELTDLAKI